ncbi:MAG: SHOCT domain-containing protein [Alphaproteobacteria bacterium]
MLQLPVRVIAFLVVLGFSLSASAQQRQGGYGYMHDGWGWGHWIFGGAMMAIFWGGLILLVVLLVRWLGRSERSSVGSSPLDILKERYARGEIDKKEYEERSRVLGK